MNRRLVLLLLIVLIVATYSYAGEPYRVGVLRGPTAVAFAAMIETPVSVGGRSVEVVTFPSPPNLIAAYLGGDVDAATLPSNAAAQLAGRGAPVEVASTFIWGVLYVVGPAGLRLHELSGPVHSIGRGASPDIVFRYVLAQEGLEDEITVEYGHAQVELSQLLIASRVRAGVLPEPFVTRVLDENPALGVVADLQALFRKHAETELPQTVLVTRPGDEYGAGVVDALETSVGWVLENPDESARLVATLGLGLDEQTALRSLSRLNLRVERPDQSEAALRSYLRILHAFEPAAVGGQMPPDSFYGR